MPGCSSSDSSSSSSSSRALMPELQGCSWKVQMQRHSARWYAFNIPQDAASNMSVVIMARALSGQITMALWAPGSDPYRSVPTQVGTNYMEWPGLREADQQPAAAGGGHASIASEQQYLLLAHKEKALAVGQYILVVHADMGQPLVQVEVSTPSSMTQLVADEQEALKQLVGDCCPGLSAQTPSSSSSSSSSSSTSEGLSGWCSSVGHAVTYDLRQWYADICHVAPNVCDQAGHLTRLVLPPYALRCREFPKALAKFSKLSHLDISYSSTPGNLADVAAVVARLPQLQQLHLRGVGLAGAFSCELLQAGKKLRTLELSDNDNLAGSLPGCFLESASLQELQLAGLSRMRGPLPLLSSSKDAATPAAAAAAAAGSSDASMPKRRALLGEPQQQQQQQGCEFGKLQYVNMAGVIGDQEPGLTGPLPSLAPCSTLLYLDLSGHALSGPLPSLPQGLQFLNLSSNGLSQQLPQLAGSPSLQYLDLSFNRFSGVLEDMSVLPSLDWLDLSDNELTGPLPAFPLAVRWIDLSNNQLAGALELPAVPADSERLLVLLNLSGNKLTGPLSSSVTSAAPHLSFLDLSHNGFSGSLAAFADALTPSNQLLQVNLSHNRLSGGVPAGLASLAAVRPVMVTMKDGHTPVHRILDLSNNELQGVFPAWIITNLPALASSCKCSIGISLDAPRFTCPWAVPATSRKAQDVLHGFEYLQCVSTAGGKRQQVPIWQLAGPSYQYTSRERRKHYLATLQAQQQQQQQQHRGKLSGGAIAGIVIGVVGSAVMAAAAVLVVVVRRRSSLRDGKIADALLQHYDPYQPGSDTPLGAGPFLEATPSGSPTYSAAASAASASSSSAGSRRSSQSGDGMCEIALVVKGVSGSGRVQGSAAKDLSKDGVV
ncbi:hypothetical protein OEZ86_002357 [Tetradesmus obliquus]|nr:hypothetical protein OEZ86_002357 [Tetradesmus obliquus]